MAVARKSSRAGGSARTKAAPSKKSELICTDCGRTFSRPAALGAHRRHVHQIAGTKRQRANATTRPRPSRGSGVSAATVIDRDALLSAIFPDGVPARHDVIRSVNDWLNEAERLASL
jgi:hypothetical protein